MRLRVLTGGCLKYLGFALVILTTLSLQVIAQDAGTGGIGGRPAYPRADNPRSESIFIHTIEPNDVVEDGVKVINNSPETKTVNIYATDSENSSGGAFACKQKVEEKSDVGSWISLDKSVVTIESANSEVVPFTINVPTSVDVGEHNGCIVIQEEKLTDNPDSGIGLSFRTAIRVAILIPGEINKQLEIIGFTHKIENEKVVLTPKVLNTGNVSIDAEVQTRLAYPFNIELSTAGGKFPVLRDQETEWNFEHQRPFWGGFVKTALTIEYDQNPENYIGEGETDRKVLTYPGGWIFVMPQPLALASYGLFVVLALLILFKIVRNLSIRRKFKTKWQAYVINSGDDIRSVAKKHNISWKQLAKANKLRAPYTIKDGTVIKVPPKK